MTHSASPKSCTKHGRPDQSERKLTEVYKSEVWIQRNSRGEWGYPGQGIIPDRAIVVNRESLTLLHYPIVLATLKFASAILPPGQLVSSINSKITKNGKLSS